MIIIKFYGLDQFIVGDFAKENAKKIADLLEVKEDEILFYAPNAYIFHKEFEQTNWNTYIELCLYESHHDLQDKIVKLICSTLKECTINFHFLFHYYPQHHFVSVVNKEYPMFLTDKNAVEIEDEHLDDEIDVTDENVVYTGNVFKDFDKKK